MLREKADIGGALSGRPGAWHTAKATAAFYFGLGVRWSGWPCWLDIYAAHRGFRSNCHSEGSCSEGVATLPALPPLSPCPEAHPAICRASNYSRAPQPLAFFLWRHRKCHLLL